MSIIKFTIMMAPSFYSYVIKKFPQDPFHKKQDVTGFRQHALISPRSCEALMKCVKHDTTPVVRPIYRLVFSDSKYLDNWQSLFYLRYKCSLNTFDGDNNHSHFPSVYLALFHYTDSVSFSALLFSPIISPIDFLIFLFVPSCSYHNQHILNKFPFRT